MLPFEVEIEFMDMTMNVYGTYISEPETRDEPAYMEVNVTKVETGEDITKYLSGVAIREIADLCKEAIGDDEFSPEHDD